MIKLSTPSAAPKALHGKREILGDDDAHHFIIVSFGKCFVEFFGFNGADTSIQTGNADQDFDFVLKIVEAGLAEIFGYKGKVRSGDTGSRNVILD